MCKRQAVLITAYKNPEQIKGIIDFLGEDFEYYIHADKKSRVDFSVLQNISRVHFYQKYKVNWGSADHLKCILLLSREALADGRNHCFHLITGQDFPAKTADYFLRELDTSRDYLEHFPLPSERWGGGLDRIRYFTPYESVNGRSRFGIRLMSALIKTQKLLGIKRKTLQNSFGQLYGGSTYWSLTRNSLQYVLDTLDKNPKIMRSMKYTFCSEEIIFQTVLMNSPFAKNVANDNLRYIDWESGRGGHPAFLDESDIDSIKHSNKIFARKFRKGDSDALREILTQKSP